ncbi:NADPH-dependent FMN reductase [Domibacillus indicus]|uniref:NADPH-dependent FMN reductase n=1 Tax=Domibacillus indicus TaxID=1437523 RepID=UPI0020411A47|nr:NADPH-dependent FMN reductase [Domibacillus indicus]MCM3791029.1 NADPH-dependent FMN reductase [Domibacillus indicus]
MKKVTILSGSPSTISKLNEALKYMMIQLEQSEVQVEFVSICGLPAEDLLHARYESDSIQTVNALLAESDAVIVGTPVYKGSYSGILKTYLDLLPQKGLENKLLLPVAVGGTMAHLLMLEYNLKPLLSVLGGTQIEKGIFIQNTQVIWNEQKQGIISEEITARLTASIDQFLNKLMKDEAVCSIEVS